MNIITIYICLSVLNLGLGLFYKNKQKKITSNLYFATGGVWIMSAMLYYYGYNGMIELFLKK